MSEMRDVLLSIGKGSHAETLAMLQGSGSKRELHSPTTDSEWISLGISSVALGIQMKLLQRLPGNWMLRTADETSVALSCAVGMCATSFLHTETLRDAPEYKDLLGQSIVALFSGLEIIHPEAEFRELVRTSDTLKNLILQTFARDDHPVAVQLGEHLAQLFLLYPINRHTKKQPEEQIDKALFLIYDNLRSSLEEKR